MRIASTADLIFQYSSFFGRYSYKAMRPIHDPPEAISLPSPRRRFCAAHISAALRLRSYRPGRVEALIQTAKVWINCCRDRNLADRAGAVVN